MPQPATFQSLRQRPFAQRLERVQRFRVSPVYRERSRVLRDLEDYHQIARTVLEHIHEDRNLTDEGKATRATKDAILSTLRDLNAAEKQVRAGIHRRQKQREEIVAKRTPQAPDLGALIRTMIAVSLTEGDPAGRKALIDRMLNPDRTGTATPENAVALSLPPEAFGAAGESRVEALRHRIGLVNLGHEGQQLDLEDHLAGEELKALGELRGAVAACGDIPSLVEAGAIPKPFAMMTHEERVAYTIEHGVEALHALAFRDQEYLGLYTDPTPALTFDQVDPAAPSPIHVQSGADGRPAAVSVAA